MNYTPGPWQVDPKAQWRVAAANNTTVASTACQADEQDRWDGNAQLIAEAPALLEALKALVSYTEACEGLLNAAPAGQVIKARAVITKAEGK